MRKEVYTKFAEALEKGRAAKAAAARAEVVHTKFAEALEQRRLQKKAGYGALARIITRLSPKVKTPGKLNPLRLVTTTTQKSLKATNAPTGAAGAGGSAYGGAYQGGAGGIRSYGDLRQLANRTTTRLSPGKILAALGVGGGGAAAAKGLAQNQAAQPAQVQKSDLWTRVLANPKLVAALAGAGLLAAGGIGGYMLAGGSQKKKPSETY